MLQVVPCPAETALCRWDDFKGYFETAALEHPQTYNLAELRQLVADEKLLSIGIFDGEQTMVAAAAVELYHAQDGRTLHVRYLAGGEMNEWLDELMARLIEIARAYNCRWISQTGRQGWQRVLAKKFGWKTVAIQMRCEVPNGGI